MPTNASNDIVTRKKYPPSHEKAGKTRPFWFENANVKRPNGESVRLRSSTGTNDKKIARARTAHKIHEIETGQDQLQGQFISLEDALNRYWLEHVCKGTGEPKLASASFIRKTFLHFIRLLPELTGRENPLLNEISNNVVAQYVATRSSEPNQNFKREKSDQVPLVGPKAVNNELCQLRAVLTRARVRWGYQVDTINSKGGPVRRPDPVRFDLHFLDTPDSPKRTITPDQQRRIIEFCNQPENSAQAHVGALLMAGLWCPLRKMNLTQLDWSQVDMQARTITVRVKSKRPGGRLLVTPIIQPFWMWLANQGPQKKGRVFQRWDKNSGARGKDGQPLGRMVPFDSFKRAWNTVREECDLEGITWHEATRKTAATRILLAGGDLVTAQKALGHSDIQTTMDYIGITDANVSTGLERAAEWAEVEGQGLAHFRHTNEKQEQ